MADADQMFRILADADVDLVVVNGRRGDEIVACALAPQLVEGVFRIAVELPQQLAVGIERIDPAVAAREDDLRLALDDSVSRVRPLPVLDQLAAVDKLLDASFRVAALADLRELDGRIVVLPEDLAIALVHLDEARRPRRRHVDMS